MPFDSIMQVGKTYQVSKDIYAPPYLLNDERNIAFMGISRTLFSGTGSPVVTGTLSPLFNDENDASTTIYSTTILNSANTHDIIIDFGKSIYLKEASIKLGVQVSGIPGAGTYYINCDIETSEDGIFYQDLRRFQQALVFADIGVEKINEYSTSNLKGRFIRFRYSRESAFGTTGVVNYYRIKVINSRLQEF